MGHVPGFVGDLVVEGLEVGLRLKLPKGLVGYARGPSQVLGVEEW